MGDFEPAPPIAVPPPRPRFWTRGRLIAVAVALAVIVTAVVLLTRRAPGPGEVSWRPLSGTRQVHSSTGEAGLQFAQILENTGDVGVVIESARAEVPPGFTQAETGTLSLTWLSEYYLLTPPKLTALPVRVEVGKQVKLVLRFHVSCPPAQPAKRVPWRLFLTVSASSVRQGVEVGELADIELGDRSLPEFCGSGK
ncbi:hypothetical protein [Amycolatopsis samaneae]|uniref:Uncharacterized protein n=1 Tax=Amycolatopsis samaneae TaxID=664691 RepID=A0ABW5G9Q9_9PSEU